MQMASSNENSFVPMEKGQAEKRPGLLGEIAHNKLLGTGSIFRAFFVRGGTTSLCCAQAPSPKRRDQNGHDHDHFQKFQSISPPFAAGCSGLFRQGTRGSNAFLKFFEPCGRRLYFG